MMVSGRPAFLGAGLGAQPTPTECKNACNKKYHACTSLCDGPTDIFCFNECSNAYLTCANACPGGKGMMAGLGLGQYNNQVKEPDIWCWLPDVLLTTEEIYFCRNLKGKVPLIETKPPAPVAQYPYLSQTQTPAEVIAAQREATLQKQREEAARQAEEYQRDIDTRAFKDLLPPSGETPWGLYALLAGAAVLGVVALKR